MISQELSRAAKAFGLHARALAEAFYESRGAAGESLLAAGYELGAVAGARRARVLAGRAHRCDALLSSGVRSKERPGRVPGPLANVLQPVLLVEDGTPSATALLVFEAFAAGAEQVAWHVRGAAAPYAEVTERLLESLFEGRAQRLPDAPSEATMRLGGAPSSDLAAGSQLSGHAVAVVSPYCWDRADLSRLIHCLALESLAAAPGVGEVRYLWQRDWEQRRQVEEALAARLESAGAGVRHRFVASEQSDLHAWLVESAAESEAALVVSRWVHPIHAERPAISAALERLEPVNGHACAGVRGTAGYMMGCGFPGLGPSLRLSSATLALRTPSVAEARLRAAYEASPSAWAASQLAVRNLFR